MKDIEILSGLKEYLTRDYMRLIDEKDQMMNEILRLEAEEKKVKDLFFNGKKINRIRQMFSPIDHFLTEYHQKEREDDSKYFSRIKELENNVNIANDSIDEIKDYLSYIQRLIHDLKVMKL